jgi:hypothetical protein
MKNPAEASKQTASQTLTAALEQYRNMMITKHDDEKFHYDAAIRAETRPNKAYHLQRMHEAQNEARLIARFIATLETL